MLDLAPSRAKAGSSVDSEVGALRRVIVHRPGPELTRLTPANRDQLLFEDVVWAERATEEHDELTAALDERGAEVLQLAELLADVLDSPTARDELLAATARESELSAVLARELTSWLAELPSSELVVRLIGGITYAELPFRSRSLAASTDDPAAFVLGPLPNQMFTRDTSAWVYGGVSVHAMARPARRREALHLEAIYRHHPRFASARLWNDGLTCPLQLEGGDVLVIGNSTVLVGVGERTSPAAVELYAQQLFTAGAAERVIVTVLPARRATIHLDTVLTMVDRDAFTVYRGLAETSRAHVLRPSANGEIEVEERGPLFDVVRDALGVSVLRVIRSHGDRSTELREQWDEGNNVLAVEPGVVIAYERNTETNACLREHGIEVITVPGSELARGRGGPRCLSCPVERAPIR
jgi:arginine deiminase